MAKDYRQCKYCGDTPGGRVRERCTDPNGHDFVVASDLVCSICRHSPYDNLSCREARAHDFRPARELMSLRDEY